MKTPNNNNSQIQQRAARPARWPAFVCAITTLFAAGVQAQITFTPVFSNAWVLPATSYADMPADNGSRIRGVTINPVTTNVLYASQVNGTNNGATHISTVSFASGSNYIAGLNGSGLANGTFLLDQVRVSDDGFVYSCNLSTAPVSNFKLYRWPSESDVVTAATVVFATGAGTSFQWRIGDYMDLRGSGSNTEIVVVGSTGSGANITTNFTIFRPTDDTATTFTNFSITVPGSGPAANLCGGGVAFEGTNNVIWIREVGSQRTRRVSYNPATLTATCDRTNTVDQSACQGLKYYKANGVELLATVQASSTLNAVQIARAFQIPASPTAALVSVLSSNMPVVTGSQNANALGMVDARNGYFVFGAPSHGLSFFKLGFVTNSPPSVTGPNGGGTFIEGLATNTLTVTASGSTPLRYQWYFNTNTPVGSNTNFLTLSPVQLTNAGTYNVVVTNAFGAATSGVVTLTVLPKKFSNLATQLWTLAPGSRDYLANDNNQRGAAYDPIFQRVVLVSRTPTNGVHLIDAQTGADQGDMDVAAIATAPPGIFAINACGVADDGAVYVGNLITSGSSDTFAIYQYAGGATNTATMVPVYFGNPLAGTGSAGRIGDTMTVRGAGTNTEILCSFRNGTNVAIFTTTDGSIFNFNLIAVSNFPAILETDSSPAGLGVAWGTGKTFWVKSSGFNLRQVQYDLASQVGGVIHSYNNSIGTEQAIGVDNANGYVATIGATENPQTLPIYDLFANDGNSVAALLDREVFPANNVNGNATGAVAFDIAGGRLFALDSNNGLLALTYAPRLYITPAVQGGVVTWAGPGTLQAAALVTGPYVDVVTTSPYTNTAASQNYFRVRR